MGIVRRQISPHAARLRRQQTEAEQRFWLAVRDRQLGGFKFRRQATIEKSVVDFLCVEATLIVELDGGQHSAMRNTARTATLEARGYRVIRFWNNEVLENFDGVLSDVKAALEDTGARRPSPNPLPQAGEG